MRHILFLIGLIALLSAVPVGAAEAWSAVDDADVIVVGAGFAGMVAAVEAADTGARVVLFEKTARTGGSVVIAGGSISGANAMMQYEAGITHDSPEAFYADIYRLGRGKHDPELAWTHVRQAGLAVDYMDKMGVDFGDREPGNSAYDPFDIDRQYMAEDGGLGYFYVLDAAIDERIERGRIQLFLSTEVIDLIQDETGQVTGVTAVDVETGESTDYAAPATILATGGYAANMDLIRRYNYENALTAALPHATGDGYVMAEKIGAGFANMDYLPAYPGSIPLPDSGDRHRVAAQVVDYPGAIWVNQYGQRMTSEDGLTVTERQDVWANAPANTVYIILDSRMRAENDSVISGQDWEYFDGLIEDGVVQTAGSIPELADKLGIASRGLVETVERYNGFVDAGEDEDFGRSDLTYGLEEAPFFGFKTYPYVLLSKGGPTMNTRAQLLDENGAIIWGIYQTGELVGGANIGGHGSVGGLAHTINVVWGRISGQNAAEYALSQRR